MKKLATFTLMLLLAFNSVGCNRNDEPTPNSGGTDTTTTAPADTTTTTPQDTTVIEPTDTTVIEPTDTTTTEPTDTTVVEPSDTTTVLEPDTRPEHIVSENEADYYTAPKSYRKTVNLVDDYAVDSKFETDDSKLLQDAINYVHKSGGGKIIIPEGNYTFSSIELKSNIHIEIDSKAVIRPYDFNDTKNHIIFQCLSATDEYIENVSIQGIGGKFTFDLTHLVNNTKLRCIQANTLRNFLFANMIVLDQETTFSAIEFGGSTYQGKVYGPEKGVVKNVDNLNSHYGYGLMQIQYARDMLFTDLYCKGGINLRFESHYKTYFGTDCKNYINRIVCRRITCDNGHAAVAIVPHFVFNGWIDARDIYSNGCETAVTISGGYTTDEEAEAGHTAGYFSSETTFRNIYATSTDTEAQLNPSNFKYMVPQKQHLLPSNDPWTIKLGPSINIILYQAKYKVDIAERDILLATDFLDGQRWTYCEGAATEYVPTLAD